MRASLHRKLGAAILSAALLLPFVGADAEAKNKPWEKFNYPELGKLTIPDVEPVALSNGILVYLLEDHTWPLVEGEILINTGTAYEPANLVGLGSVTGDVLRTGGTTTMAADELDELLEGMGGSIESGMSTTQGNVNFSFLSQDAMRGLELVADVLRKPAFEQDKVDVTVTGMRAGIARRNDDLNSIAGRELSKAVWGSDHPYARNMEYSTVDAIGRDDLVGFYNYYYQPANLRVAVWGDFNRADMLKKLEAILGGWKGENNLVPALPEAPASQGRRVLVADKTDVTQGRVVMGHVGMRMDDVDFHSFSVMNRILGGGFGDRLFNEVRSNLGLAYNVGSGAGIGMSRPGTFQAYVGTKSETVEQAAEATLGELVKMREGEVTDAELSSAKEAILNSHVCRFVRPSQVLVRKMYYDHYGYPADFMEFYTDKIRAVGKAEILDVAQRRIRPDEMAIVAIGKMDEWDGDLSGLGPVEELDISIPEPAGPEFPEVTAESIEKGRNLLARAQKAMGGSKLTSMTSLKRSVDMGMNMGGMEMSAKMTTTVVFPDRLHNAVAMQMGEIIQSVSAESAWMKTPQGLQDVPASMADDMRSQILEDPFYLIGHYDQFEVQALDAEMVGDANADVVLVRTGEDGWVKIFVGEDGRMVRSSAKGKHPMTQAPGLQVTTYSDYEATKGLPMPMTIMVTHDGEKLFDMSVTSFELNPSVDSSIFAKPAS